MVRDSPLSGMHAMGSVPRGARWLEVRTKGGRATRGGEEDRIPVEDVGTGVGYLRRASVPVFWRLTGRGRAGEEDNGSKAGSRDDAGLLVPARGEDGRGISLGSGSVGSVVENALWWLGESAMMAAVVTVDG